MTSNSILNLVPLSMSLNLVSENFKISEKTNKVKDIIGLGLKNIVGLSLIKETGKFI